MLARSMRRCGATIREALLHVPGVHGVEVDLASAAVRVAAAPGVQSSALASAVAGAGYEAWAPVTHAGDRDDQSAVFKPATPFVCTSLLEDATETERAAAAAAASPTGGSPRRRGAEGAHPPALDTHQPAPSAACREASFSVGGMSCSSCVFTIERAVAALPGVLS
ncbi:hypothetical protein EON68_02510, partial [archaeon]